MATDVAIKRERKDRWARSAEPEGFRLTERDERIVEEVWRLRFTTADQICDLFFAAGARSNCQRRLTLLHEHKFLSKLVGRAINEPDVYCLTRDSAAGLRLLRSRVRTADLLRRSSRVPQVEHVLAINDVRGRLQRAARLIDAELADWRNQGELAWLGAKTGFVPDAFFVLQRQLSTGVLTSAHFLEVERSARGTRAVLRKYTRLRDYYMNGAYTRDFRHRSLRILVVTSQSRSDAEARWAATLRHSAEKAGLTFALFTSLRALLALDAEDLLRAPIWLRPGEQSPAAIGELAGEAPPRHKASEQFREQEARP